MKKSILVLTAAVLAVASSAQARSLNNGFENQGNGGGHRGDGVVQNEGESERTYRIDGNYAYYHFNFSCEEGALYVPQAGSGDNGVPEMSLSFSRTEDCEAASRVTKARPHCTLVTLTFDTDDNRVTRYSCKH